MFQYCEETTGICEIVKYSLSTFSADVVPARRAETTAAPGLCAKRLPPA